MIEAAGGDATEKGFNVATGRTMSGLSPWEFHSITAQEPRATWLTFPFWLPVLVSAMLSAIPWIRQLPWRFTLRTLLIATTLIAVGLGLIVWTFRAAVEWWACITPV